MTESGLGRLELLGARSAINIEEVQEEIGRPRSLDRSDSGSRGAVFNPAYSQQWQIIVVISVLFSQYSHVFLLNFEKSMCELMSVLSVCLCRL